MLLLFLALAAAAPVQEPAARTVSPVVVSPATRPAQADAGPADGGQVRVAIRINLKK